MSIKIISCHPVFNENAIVLSQKFNWKLETQFDPQAGDIYLVLGGHEMAHQLLEIQFRKNASYGYIIMNSEQIHSQFMKNKYYIELMKRNVVFDYTTINTDYLKKTHDIKVLSYFFFEFLRVETKNKKPKYDVTFIGSKTEDRVKLMKDLEEEFNDLNFYIDFDWKHGSSNAMTEIMNDSKVVLNIGYYSENRPLETHRINKALACHCDVVSLKSDDTDANEFYDEYCYMTDDIKTTLHKYFNDELEPKKPYEHLVKTLAQKFHPHMMFIVDHIQKKLKSIHNNNGTTEEIVSQSTSTDTTVSTNSSKEIKTGE